MNVNLQRDDDATESGILRLLKREGPTENVSIAVAILDHIEQAGQMRAILDCAVDDVLDLRASQVSALKEIASSPCTIEELADRLGLIMAAAQPTVDSLVDLGYVVATGSDVYYATEAGLATVDRADAIRYRSADLASGQLTAEQRAELPALLGVGFSSARQLRRA